MTSATETSVTKELAPLLGSSYLLDLKTQNYHWNVTGPMFTTLHTLFEQQYIELATAIDEIAERIRSLGSPAPGSLTEFAAISTVKEETGHPNAEQMIRNLVEDQKSLAKVASRVIKAAEAAGDEASADLAIRRTEVHEKNAWMLHSHLE